MNSLLKSVGNFFRYALLLAFALGLLACTSSPKEGETSVKEDLSGEVSLKADRSYLDQERQNIPAEIKKANDELAFDLEQMAVIKEKPDRIRSRFQDKTRKIREKFRNKIQKSREKFNTDERKAREAFLKEQAKAREEFKKKKHDREEVKEFYAEQELKRKDFTAAAKEKRTDYEAEAKSHSKDFDESLRERTKQFNDQLRIYTQRFNEQKRCEERGECPKGGQPGAATSRGEPSATTSALTGPRKTVDMREFEEMKKVPGVRLTPQPDGQ